MIDSASKSLVNLDLWADRAPVVSTITNLSLIVLKCVRPIIEYLSNKLSCVKNLGENRLVKHIFNKPASRCFTLLVPFVGNFVVYREETLAAQKVEKKLRKHAAKELFEEAYKMKWSSESVAILEEAAKLGNAQAMNLAGRAHYHGYGVEKNAKKGLEYLEKASEHGCSNALYNLGHIYFFGTETEKNIELAKVYLTKAANLGHGLACDHLGDLFRKNDPKQAFYWYEKGAKLGNADSMNSVGKAYTDGLGVEKNDQKAFNYYKKAAEKNDETGIHNLGWSYLFGRGVDIDLKLAEHYLTESANLGSRSSKYLLGVLYEVQSHLSKAKEWYQKAANDGHIKASERLEEIKKKSKGWFSFS